MFWKMLRSDLRRDRGLNLVLLLFITAASVLVCVGSVQMLQSFTANERNRQTCKISDIIMFNELTGGDSEEMHNKCDEILRKNSDVLDFYSREVICLKTKQVDFEQLDEDSTEDFRYAGHYLTTVPKEKDLLFDLDGKPFYVPNGKVYVSEKLRLLAQAQVGDRVKFITDSGNIYELEIAGFFKQPYMGWFKWYVLSDADYELLRGEYFTKTEQYGIQVAERSFFIRDELFKQLMNDCNVNDMYLQFEDGSDDYILGVVLTAFLALISVFMILIIVMTIRFTMLAALKEEEREIGTLRALGVDSFGFRWIFAAKYIAFAVVGGAVGVAAGLPLSKLVLDMFGASNIQPHSGVIVSIGVCSVLFMTALMIGFSMLVMQRINKISVIEAIRSNSYSDRYGQSGVMYLHKRKRMPTAFYLALSDILKRFRRYVFLLIAYTLAVFIILMAVNVKNSVISTDFLKYSLMYQTDFYLQFTDEQGLDIIKTADKAGIGFWDEVNKRIRNARIPAHIDADHRMTTGLFDPKGQKVNTTIYFGNGDISRLSYVEGGTVPVKKDEIAFSSITARSLGIDVGDEVTLAIAHEDVKTDEIITKNEKFRVTALINMMDNGDLTAITGSEYKNSSRATNFFALIIDAQGEEREQAFSKLEALFGEEVVLTGDEYVHIVLADYDSLFTLLEYVLGGVLLFIIMLMTYLYSSVFIAEEKSEIALLKSLGFTERNIRKIHLLRILILSVSSVILGEVLLHTAGSVLLDVIMEELGISGFGFLPEYLFSCAVVPLLVIGAVLLIQRLNLKKLDSIAVWNIADE